MELIITVHDDSQIPFFLYSGCDLRGEWADLRSGGSRGIYSGTLREHRGEMVSRWNGKTAYNTRILNKAHVS